MKFNTFLVVVSLIGLTFESPINTCKKSLKIKNSTTLLDIAIKEKIPFEKIKSLNSNLNLNKTLKKGFNVCVEGDIDVNEIESTSIDEVVSINKIPTDQQIKLYRKILKKNLSKKNIDKLKKTEKAIDNFLSKAFEYNENTFNLETCERQCTDLKAYVTKVDKSSSEIYSLKLINKFRKSAKLSPYDVHTSFYNPCLNASSTCVDPTVLGNVSFLGITMKKYKKDSSEQNAVAIINGCSIPKALNKVVSIIAKGAYDFEPYYTPACNAHDTCYSCGSSKTTCDDKFYDNMLAICDKIDAIYDSSSMTKACEQHAYWYHWGVKYFSKSFYTNAHDFVKENKNTCDYCARASDVIYTMFVTNENTIY
ncbi:hypothetical protein LY90DRAFT_706378 [Neocallimastix californiae]|uniref:LysM domain-containing protein n=1 Tax=Neocallimastix californiae TaxID=1754190 RepID=A0A1Y2ASF4_9FUNG|nr:hypothetical protein LY90DRAFT_706378 [Neocallimastix californiae]|eukprot:ORY25230.1 hypothetical protein LY90DRAFT_706378 [Neocallimastix californiae]